MSVFVSFGEPLRNRRFKGVGIIWSQIPNLSRPCAGLSQLSRSILLQGRRDHPVAVAPSTHTKRGDRLPRGRRPVSCWRCGCWWRSRGPGGRHIERAEICPKRSEPQRTREGGRRCVFSPKVIASQVDVDVVRHAPPIGVVLADLEVGALVGAPQGLSHGQR
jgi:hypothetical protein